MCCGTVGACQKFGISFGLMLNPADVAICNPETSVLTQQTTTYRHNTERKGKVHPRTGHEDPEGEKMYTSSLSITSALDGGGWSTPRPGRFNPGKTRYPLYRRLGGPQGRSGRVRKTSPPTESRSPDRRGSSQSLY